MVIYYFGADDTWNNLSRQPFRRRNTLILDSLVTSSQTSQVLVVKKTTRVQFIKYIYSENSKQFGKVKDVYFFDFFPRLLKLERLNRAISRVVLNFQVKHLSNKIYLWAYWPKGYKNLLESGLTGYKIFDTDHNIIEDPNLEISFKKVREIELLKYAKDADIVLSSVRSMINWYINKGCNNLFRFRNGISLGAIQSESIIKERNKLTIVYCGTLSRWINYDMMSLLMSRNPDWKLIVIGKPYLDVEWKRLSFHGNVEFIGEKSPEDASVIMRSCVAGINLYKSHPALDVDSMKIYDYLAAGIPVISTRYHSYLKEDFNDLIYIINDINELENCIVAIWDRRNIDNQNNRRQFLHNSTWDFRLSDFLNYIRKTNAREI